MKLAWLGTRNLYITICYATDRCNCH